MAVPVICFPVGLTRYEVVLPIFIPCSLTAPGLTAEVVVERSEHSFDPFPDKARVLPWGVGCSIVYNYVDLVVRHDTDLTFRVVCSVGERHLGGELRSDRPTPHSYRVHARHEAFVKAGDDLFRRNEIWRTVIDKRTGDAVGEELLKSNCALVRYEPPDDIAVIDASLARASGLR